MQNRDMCAQLVQACAVPGWVMMTAFVTLETPFLENAFSLYLLNNIIDGMTGHSERTNGDETNTGWRTVESKQDIKEKRKRSRVSADMTENVSRVNEKVNCKRTSFGNE